MGIKGGILQANISIYEQLSRNFWAYGGSSRFGRLSIRISPSLGGGSNGSGGHAVMLCGVFQGTVGGEVGSEVDAWRMGAIRRRHWGEICGRAARRRPRVRPGAYMVRGKK